MERNNKCKCFSTILWAVLATVLCAQASAKASSVLSITGILNVGTGKDMQQIQSADYYRVDVQGQGTLNLYLGAYIEPVVRALSGSTVNIYAGNIGAYSHIQVNDGADVTVYGTGFADSSGPVGYGEWTPATIGEILTGTYENGSEISLLFFSDIAIHLLQPNVEPPQNQLPVANAWTDLTVFTKDIATTVINGTATDPDEGDSLTYRWLEEGTAFTLFLPVGANGEAPLNLGTILPQYLGIGTHTLTLQVSDATDTVSDDMVLTIAMAPLMIDIKPGSYPNSINLGSKGVVPVAILSTSGFNATLIPADTAFLAGSGVAVRGKGNNALAQVEDVNGDGLMDLVVMVETENLDPGTFQDGGAVLRVHETSEQTSAVLYEGWDEITIVPQG